MAALKELIEQLKKHPDMTAADVQKALTKIIETHRRSEARLRYRDPMAQLGFSDADFQKIARENALRLIPRLQG